MRIPAFPKEPPNLVQIMRNLGMEPDPWQTEVLQTTHARLLLNCCRQAGKSTVVALRALVEALFTPLQRVLIVSRSHRQARELFRQILFFYRLLGKPLEHRHTADELELTNLSRILCVPCKEETIRGFAGATLVIIDEASLVPDDVYRAVRPMLAVSGGRMFCLSTPRGKRGFFFDAWAHQGDDWLRVEVPAARIPRITAAFLAEERRALGEAYFRQEYCCSFEALEGLVYPDFARCVVPALPESIRREDTGWRIGSAPRQVPLTPRSCRRVGGIDFGYRNPFAAVWGLLDQNDVLWLLGEYYARGKPLSEHMRHLPRDVCWYADPSGANERAELRCNDFQVLPGLNPLRTGITAVTARLESERLKVLQGRCPNLLAEAELYRYGDTPQQRDAEKPLDEYNHALAALRYMLARLDAGRRRSDPGTGEAGAPPQAPKRQQPWLRLDNEQLWTPL